MEQLNKCAGGKKNNECAKVYPLLFGISNCYSGFSSFGPNFRVDYLWHS